MLVFGLKAKSCWENHYIVPISQSGTESVVKTVFYCKDCNKVRTIRDWNPKICRLFSELSFKVKCKIHENDKDWLPF